MKYRKKGASLVREIAGESLLVPIHGKLADLQRVFVLEGVGGFIWTAIEEGRTSEEICGQLAERFEVDRAQAEEDFREFAAKLLEADLIEEGE